MPEELRQTREARANVQSMISLLEQGVETGKWPAAVQSFVQQRFGVDLGQDPGLATFRALAQSEALGAAQSLKGAMSDNDVRFLQEMGAMTSRSREGNLAVLKARDAIYDRKARELTAEQEFYSRNGSLFGFDQWLAAESAKWGPVIPDAVVREITSTAAQGAQKQAQAFASLAEALKAGDAAAVAGFVQDMDAEDLAKLPTATLEALDRLLGQ